MSSVTQIIISVVVGGVIGSLTNALAIYMMFRPYEPIKIGNVTLPFTPGLVPKRRSEIANQLGKIVKEHLIKPERIKEKLINEKLINHLENLMKTQLATYLQSGITIKELLHQLSISIDTKKLIRKFVASKKESWNEKTVAELLGNQVTEKVEGKFEAVSEVIIERIQTYIEGEEGKQIVNDSIRKMIENTGMLSGMLSMFVSNIDIASKVQNELHKLLKRDTTKQFVTGALEKEWAKIKDMQIKDVFEYIGENDMEEQIVTFIDQTLAIDTLLDSKIENLISSYRVTIDNVVIPKLVSKLVLAFEKEIPKALEFIEIESIVEEEVNAFSLPKLEKIIVSVTKKELKAITYLGGILGGVIGLVQGLFYYFV